MVRSQPTPSTTDTESVFDDVVYTILTATSKATWALIRWAFLFPMLSLPLAGCIVLASTKGKAVGTAALVVYFLALVLWRLLHPASFRRWVTDRIRRRWRRWAVYTRPWADICALHGLVKTLNGTVLVPRLDKLTLGHVEDVLIVPMLPGQTVMKWASESDALAHAFKAHNVKITSPQPGWIRIEVRHGDTLTNAVRVSRPVEPVDLTALPVGVHETGHPWLLRLLGRHILIAGATGAGKGGVVWSLLAGIAPAIRDHLVTVWVIDPKGGMEFGSGQPLFDRFAHDAGQGTLDLLRDAVTVMTERANRLRGVTRQHIPTAAEPLLVVIIDEIASLTAYISDRKIKAEVEQLVGLLLSQGRAVGVSVVACVQDPSKDVLVLRQLFPTRIALRMSETTQTSMVLGTEARDHGALCDLIPESAPGVAYVGEDGSNQMNRVRAFHVTDDDITALCRDYAPPTNGPAA